MVKLINFINLALFGLVAKSQSSEGDDSRFGKIGRGQTAKRKAKRG
jgi:hypothetical protein